MDKIKYGWIPDKKDDRDFLYKNITRKPVILPDVVDLRDKCSPVDNQGTLGSCTANALVGSLEFCELANCNAEDYFQVSRLFIYYNERKLEGTVQEDSGAMLRDGIKTLVSDGYCHEYLCPYDIENFTDEPSIEAYKDAENYKISSYHSVNGLNEMLQCLAEGYPVVFGIKVFESFETDEVKETGNVPMPDEDYEELLGGHAVCAVGYDSNKKIIIVRNSWGTEWGMEGYFTLPFKYVEKYANDLWTIRK